MICNVCGSSQSELLFFASDYEFSVPGAWKIVRCSSCGLFVQDPLPAAGEIAGFYPPAYPAFHTDTMIGWMLRVVFARDARLISRLVPREGRILDVGCGDGAALRAIRDVGFTRLTGVEIDPAAAQHARDSGLDVHCGELLDVELPAASFDLVRMGHVIEHVLDPMGALKRAFRLLKPGGILMGETPNTDCLDCRLFKRYWGALHIPRHICLFNDGNLRRALVARGFVDIEIRPGLRTVGWSAGVQNLLADRAGLAIPPAGRISWYGLLIALFLPFTLAQAAFGKTATIAFRARKPLQ
jgi:SAM-dependent methyltransferase